MSTTLQTVAALSPVFPPSFGSNPVLYGLALFARSLVMCLSAATMVRLYSLSRAQRLACHDPVFYHRLMIGCFLCSTMLASFGDTVTNLLWGEVGGASLAHLLLASKVADALSVVPFMAALTVPVWVGWLRRKNFCAQLPLRVTVGMADLRGTWRNSLLPMQLAAGCALTSVAVTLAKVGLYAAGAHS